MSSLSYFFCFFFAIFLLFFLLILCEWIRCKFAYILVSKCVADSLTVLCQMNLLQIRLYFCEWICCKFVYIFVSEFVANSRTSLWVNLLQIHSHKFTHIFVTEIVANSFTFLWTNLLQIDSHSCEWISFKFTYIFVSEFVANSRTFDLIFFELFCIPMGRRDLAEFNQLSKIHPVPVIDGFLNFSGLSFFNETQRISWNFWP